MAITPSQPQRIPPLVLGLSLAALAVPVAGAFLASDGQTGSAAFLWLAALIPAFPLGFYHGWKGVSAALALGATTLAVTQVVAVNSGREVPADLWSVLLAFIGICLGVGWLSERLHQERGIANHLALTDSLTGLPNRRAAELTLHTEFAAAVRGRRITVILFDLDKFKLYNDKYGHVAGDKALQAFSRVLERTTRKMNMSARLGGEEFLSLVSDSDVEGAAVFAERVLHGLRQENLGEGPLTASAGMAAYRKDVTTVEDLIAEADTALYRAKQEGRDRVYVSAPTVAAILDQT